MKKLLLISIGVSILVVIFNRCFCENPVGVKPDTVKVQEEMLQENEAISASPIRLRKRV